MTQKKSGPDDVVPLPVSPPPRSSMPYDPTTVMTGPDFGPKTSRPPTLAPFPGWRVDEME